MKLEICVTGYPDEKRFKQATASLTIDTPAFIPRIGERIEFPYNKDGDHYYCRVEGVVWSFSDENGDENDMVWIDAKYIGDEL